MLSRDCFAANLIKGSPGVYPGFGNRFLEKSSNIQARRGCREHDQFFPAGNRRRLGLGLENDANDVVLNSASTLWQQVGTYSEWSWVTGDGDRIEAKWSEVERRDLVLLTQSIHITAQHTPEEIHRRAEDSSGKPYKLRPGRVGVPCGIRSRVRCGSFRDFVQFLNEIGWDTEEVSPAGDGGCLELNRNARRSFSDLHSCSVEVGQYGRRMILDIRSWRLSEVK